MFNESEILFEDLYDPRLIYFYQVFWTLSFSYTSVYFAFIIYVIVKKSSREMGAYKWYLVHQMCWIFLFDLHMSMWKPVTLWPFYMVYSVGFWRNVPSKYFENAIFLQMEIHFQLLSGELSFIPVIILVAICCGMGFSLYISTIHRYIQITPFSWFYRQYSNLYFRMPMHILILIGVEIVIVLPLIILRVSPEVLEIESLKTAPQLEFFFNHESSIFGYRRSVDTNVTKFIYLLIGVFLTLVLSIALLLGNFFRIMKKHYSSSEHTAHKYQVGLTFILCSFKISS